MCQVWLVEGNTNSTKNLADAVDTAAKLGAHVISNSYSGGDGKGAEQYEPSYDHPGVAITASTGDGGYGIGTPAAMPHVIAVGGTHLVADGSDRGWTETVWRGAGSGCSKHYAKPSWQTDKGCKTRMAADVSAVCRSGDRRCGLRTEQFGHINLARFRRHQRFRTAHRRRVRQQWRRGHRRQHYLEHSDALFDVTSGSNGTCKKAYYCTGEVGYDGPTGLGTPNGTTAFGD
ncbi:MAG: S8 family serine peptidase [Rhizomicrobium sp.]